MPDQASLYDLFGHLVIYRDLDPMDTRLPRFAEAWADMGLTGPARPRKLEPAYAQAIIWLLRQARRLVAPGPEPSELVFIGDTALNDGNAFLNVRKAAGWPGWAFIGSERDEELTVSERDGIYVANRWSALAEFVSWMKVNQGAALDERTAVIVDVDKTTLGARGRNDATIDRARVAAVEATVAECLDAAFDSASFRRAYAELNTTRYHPFTADNQDNVAYVCLLLSAGFTTLESLVAEIAGGRLASAKDFMARVDAAKDRLPNDALRDLHTDIYSRTLAGDPTPFKAFRQREYVETVARMGHLPDDAPLGQRLVEEICMTREVADTVAWLRNRGALLLASSDKPDEATAPAPAQLAQGLRPLHCTPTHIVGQSLTEELPNG